MILEKIFFPSSSEYGRGFNFQSYAMSDTSPLRIFRVVSCGYGRDPAACATGS